MRGVARISWLGTVWVRFGIVRSLWRPKMDRMEAIERQRRIDCEMRENRIKLMEKQDPLKEVSSGDYDWITRRFEECRNDRPHIVIE